MFNSPSGKIDVAITYGWNRMSFNILRSLAGKGLNVAVGDASFMAMAKRSKYCFRSFSYPSFHRDPLGFIESLKAFFQEYNPEVYFPGHEETFIISKYIDEFAGTGVKIPVHDFDSLMSVHKKDSLYKLAGEQEIPVPITFKPENISELNRIWKEVSRQGKAVIKLVNTNSSKGVYYAHSAEDLIHKYTSLVEVNKFDYDQYPVVQEYVSGAGYGVSMLFNRGELRAKFSHKRLREKIASGGTSTKRVSIKNPLLEKYAEQLLGSLNWHGIAMVEFKYDEENDIGWLIDVNPRFWGSLALPIQAGVDFPYLLYKMALHGDIEPVMDYREGIVARWILGDVLATLSSIKAERSLKPILNFLSFKGEKFDDLYSDDLIPFFTEIIYYVSKFIRTGSSNPTEDALLDITSI